MAKPTRPYLIRDGLEQLSGHLSDFIRKYKGKPDDDAILNELYFFWEVYMEGKGLHGDWKYK